MAEYVIVICPCCASAHDARGSAEPQTFTCVCCGQTWTMTVEPKRHELHALT